MCKISIKYDHNWFLFLLFCFGSLCFAFSSSPIVEINRPQGHVILKTIARKTPKVMLPLENITLLLPHHGFLGGGLNSKINSHYFEAK